MADRSNTRFARILLATVLLLPLWAQGQSDRLYRVELLVFSRPAGAGAERWDATPELAYPRQSRLLIYPGEQVAHTLESPATSMPGSTLPDPAQPTLFATLPSGQRQLAGSAAAMQRSGRYQVLFHETWIQPMYSQGQAIPIVLDRSGDGGTWPALQGSIKLYLAQYFYLETNLWLNTHGDYLPGTWSMPAPPLAPASGAQQSIDYAAPAAPGQQFASTVGTSSSQPAAAAEQEDALASTPDYPYRHAVLLKQTRRIRSGDIVYIDHPFLGVLVRITPLELQATAAVPPTESPSAIPPVPAAPATPAPAVPTP